MSGIATPTSAAGGQPFVLRQRVYAIQDGTPRRATITDISSDPDGVPRYYVRFVDQDSRMDSWYSAWELRPCEVKNPKPTSVVVPTIVTRSMAAGQKTAEEPPKKIAVPTNPLDAVIKRQRKDSSFFLRPKNVASVMMGEYDVGPWYFSPYHCARPQVRANIETCSPCLLSDEGGGGELRFRRSSSSINGVGGTPTTANPVVPFVLHICPFCLEPFSCNLSVIRHLRLVCARHPPGNEVYRDVDHQLIVFELDGKLEPTFAKHLALLSKLFLEHKALDCDMTPFLFYVLCHITPLGCEVLGYFSKEKISPDGFNLSCILTLPQFQSRGIGRFLVELSYELSRREGKVGSPEKPLSDLGEVAYLSFWKDAVMDVLATASDCGSGVSIEYIVNQTSMTQQDVIATLQKLNVLTGGGGKQNRKFSLCVTSEHIRQHEDRKARRLSSTVNYNFDPSLLCWQASWYVQTPSDAALEKDYEGKYSCLLAGSSSSSVASSLARKRSRE